MEFLNTLKPGGAPPHKLSLKIGSIVMCLRNLNFKQGLCNGTRLVVHQLLNNIMEVEIIGGRHKGKRHFIPKIALIIQGNLSKFLIYI